MTKPTKVAAALGIVAGLAVSALPLASYAASEDVTVSVTIQSTLGGDEMECTTANAGSVAAGSFAEATCEFSASSNNGLSIAIKDKDAVLNLVNGANTIAPIAATETLTGNLTQNGWGYKFNVTTDTTTPGTNSNGGKYTAITASNVTVYNTNTAGTVEGDFKFGVKTPASQATGTYTDIVTITTTAL
jgi:hypothetical protein